MGSIHPLSCSFKICLWRTFRRRQRHKGGWNLFSLWLVCGSSGPSFNTISCLSHLKIPTDTKKKKFPTNTVSVGPGAYSAPGRAFSCLSLTTSCLICVTRSKMSITDVLSADDIAAALQECQGKGQGPGVTISQLFTLPAKPQGLKYGLCWKSVGSESKIVVNEILVTKPMIPLL